MNLPNKLTVSRIVLTVIFVLLILKEGGVAKIMGMLIFALASFTDFLDGYIAKKRNLETNFGKIMDPIADKVLMLSAFFIFMHLKLIAAWMFWVITFREILITGIRLFAISKGSILAAENMGKIKTVSQTVITFIFLFYLILHEPRWGFSFSEGFWRVWYNVNLILMTAVVVLTVFSGASFLKNNRKLFYV